jgi:hypothetical protein
MIQIRRFVVCSLFVFAALCVAATTRAQSPFDGTWRIDPAKAKFDQKPFTVYLSQGWYHCVSCTPPFDVAADGQFHPVSGEPFDSTKVTIVDEKTLSIVSQKGDKTIEEDTATVSADGKIATIKSVTYPLNGGASQNSSTKLKRVGVVRPGVHATSGNWVPLGFTDTEADLSFSFKSDGDQFSMTDPTGDNYTAKFDGNDYPYKSYGANGVTLKRVDAHTIVETDKRDGKAVSEQKMSVSPDGKTMTIVVHSPINNMTSTYVATKK